jgi:hypothetical protein
MDLLEELANKAEFIYGINRDPYVVAEELNMVVVLPTEYQLQLDIDTDEQFTQFKKNLEKLGNDVGYYTEKEEIHPSKSGLPKRHVTLTFPRKMDVWERITLQYYLQSDPIREGLNAMRVLLGDPYPIAFFENKVDN